MSRSIASYSSQPESEQSFIQFHPIKTSYLITSSLESNDIKIHNFINEKSGETGSPLVVSHHNAPVTCVAISPKGDYFASSSQDKTVKLFTVDSVSKSHQPTTTLVTFLNDATFVTFSPTGSYLAASTNDNIRLVNMMDHSQIITFKAHDGLIESIQYSPNGQYLATVGQEDNLLKIWSTAKISEDQVEPIHEQSLDGDFKSISWRADSSMITYTDAETAVTLSAKNGWNSGSLELEQGHTRATNCVSWSPNGRFLATSGQDKLVMIWDPETTESIAEFKHTHQISHLSWKYDGNCLSFIDVKGNVGICWNIVPNKLSPTAGMIKSNTQLLSGLFDSPDVEDEETTKKSKKSGDIDFYEDEANASDLEVDEEEMYVEDRITRKEKLINSLKPAQKPIKFIPFQSGSTYQYQKESKKNKYFLAYNMIGMIIKREDDATKGSIEIEFNEVSFHRKINFIDNNNFVMASLGKTGAVFASKGTPSSLYFKPFDSIGQNEDWSYQIPNNDKLVGVSIGNKYIVSCSEQRTLRIFTLSGLQYTMISIPGDFYTMAQSNNDKLAVVYSNDSKLNLIYIDLNNGHQIYNGDFPISPSSDLKWLGFSDNLDVLTSVDSKGIIRRLIPLWPSNLSTLQWSPIMDLKNINSKFETVTYWLVGLNDTIIYTVLCTDYPQTVPRPSLIPIQITPPLLTPEKQSNLQLEENFYKSKVSLDGFLRSNNSTNTEAGTKEQSQYDANILRLYQASLVDGKVQRCYELCQLLQFKKSLSIAIKLANDKKLITISSKIVSLMDKFTTPVSTTSTTSETSASSPSIQILENSPKTKSETKTDSKPEIKTEKESVKVPSPSSKSSGGVLNKILGSSSNSNSTTPKKKISPFPTMDVNLKTTDSKKRKDLGESESTPLKYSKK